MSKEIPKTKKGKAPTLTLSVPQRQAGKSLWVDYSLHAGDGPICIIDKEPEIVIDPEIEPGAREAPDDAFPRVYIYQAYIGRVPGLAINAFVPPPTRCFQPGQIHQGKFELAAAPASTTLASDGSPVQIERPLPPRFRVQLIIGYNEADLDLDPHEERPEKFVLDWQKALKSNTLTIKRELCWSQE